MSSVLQDIIGEGESHDEMTDSGECQGCRSELISILEKIVEVTMNYSDSKIRELCDACEDTLENQNDLHPSVAAHIARARRYLQYSHMLDDLSNTHPDGTPFTNPTEPLSEKGMRSTVAAWRDAHYQGDQRFVGKEEQHKQFQEDQVKSEVEKAVFLTSKLLSRRHDTANEGDDGSSS